VPTHAAYNNWIADLQAVPRPRDSDRAYRDAGRRRRDGELKRCIKHGFKGIFLPPETIGNRRSLI